MDEEFDTSVDTSDIDTSADIDNLDVVDDVPEDIPDDIPEDIPEDEPEIVEEDDLSDDIPEDVPEDEPEAIEEDDLSDDIPEDVPEDEPEIVEEDDLSDDIPEDIPEDELEAIEEDDLSDDIPEDVPEDEPEAIEEDDLSEDVPEDVPEEQLKTDDTTTDDAAEDTTTDVDSDNFGEQTDTQNETADDKADELNDGTQDDPSEVLKRDELDLLKSGNDAINQRLEAQADDYRDKGMSEDEIRDRLAADKWNFQKEFLEDAFPGQDVSPNVFNGLSENGAKDRIADIENSEALKKLMNDESQSDDSVSDFEESSEDEQLQEQQELAGERLSNETVSDEIVDSIVDDGDADDTDWERTSLNHDEEKLMNEMVENGEIDIDEVNAEWVEPEHTELHVPTENTGEFFDEVGNSEFKPYSQDALDKMKEFGRETVAYKNGYPDFEPFTTHESDWGTIEGQVEIGHMTDNRKNPTWEFGRRPKGKSHDPNYDLGNFAQADNAVAEKLRENYPNISGEDIEKYRIQNKLIWHECADGKTMQLVPQKIHEACRHSGGVSEMKYRMAFGDITMPDD